MSGHSKWNNIKNKKEKTDAQRAKIFTKIGKEMSVAIKSGGPNPDVNGKLRDLIAKAKSNNVPNDNIERIIKKASSADAADYQQLTYEGYGPCGVAVIVECTTDSRNRTASDIRHFFDKYGGNLGTTGCVSYMFENKGIISIQKEDVVDPDKLMENAIDAGAEDFISDEEIYEIVTEDDDLDSVCDQLKKDGYLISSYEHDKVPTNYVKLSSEDDIKNMEALLEHMEESDDVTEVYHNWDSDQE